LAKRHIAEIVARMNGFIHRIYPYIYIAPLASKIRLYRRSHGHSGHTGILGEHLLSPPFPVNLDPVQAGHQLKLNRR